MSKVNEEWRDVVGYEGLYQVSSLGNVRSLDRISTFTQRDGVVIVRKKKGCPIRSHKYTNGYLFVALCKQGIIKNCLLHRIVAATFFGESELEVNHKDGVRDNNNIENLEYLTSRENRIHSYRVLHRPPVKSFLGKRGFDHNKSIHVKVIDTLNGTEQVFGSYTIAAENGFNRKAIAKMIDKDVLYKERYRFERVVA